MDGGGKEDGAGCESDRVTVGTGVDLCHRGLFKSDGLAADSLEVGISVVEDRGRSQPHQVELLVPALLRWKPELLQMRQCGGILARSVTPVSVQRRSLVSLSSLQLSITL
ncbi:unnamed protein product [Pleuronectes platessa]|uniref:Uncharacterized protein n=1 Tax=Pleuronectes platessa TaxID=8262 RepID=A0A9N7ULD8_PLEPL|nr:unnamed protein product [Pleuronectes platessa]